MLAAFSLREDVNVVGRIVLANNPYSLGHVVSVFPIPLPCYHVYFFLLLNVLVWLFNAILVAQFNKKTSTSIISSFDYCYHSFYILKLPAFTENTSSSSCSCA